MKIKYLVSVVLLLLGPLAHADELPLVLNPETRYAEPTRFELSPFFGETFPDTFEVSFVTGVRSQINLLPTFGIGFDFAYSPVQVDSTSTFGASLTDNKIFIYNLSLASSYPAAFLRFGKTVEADLTSQLGGGIVKVNGDSRGMGSIGMGLKIHFKKVPWFAWRLDFKSFLYSLPKPSGTSFEHDLMIWTGPAFQIPPSLF